MKSASHISREGFNDDLTRYGYVMDTGIYVALSKQIGIVRDLDVTANNLANMTTTGFQGDKLLFSDYLVPATKPENRVAFTSDIGTHRNTEQGTFQQTNEPLDAAIEGQGYFAVQTPLGVRYTRNGSFKISGDGNLVTSEGNVLLDQNNQPITFDDTDRVVEIREDGTVTVDLAERGTLKIAQFDNPQLLRHVGGSLYATDAAPKQLSEDFRVASGMLERSNVQPFTELTHMLYLSRSINDTTKYISTIYDLERKASDTLVKAYS